MKRIIIMSMALCSLMAFAPEAQAQGLLKGLAGVAKDKVKQKVEQKVVGALTGKGTKTEAAKETTAKATGTFDYEGEAEENPNAVQTKDVFFFEFIRSDSDEETMVKPITFAEMLKQAPAFFDASVLLSEDGTEKIKAAKQKGWELCAALFKNIGERAEAAGQVLQTAPKATTAANPAMANFAGELMAYVQSKGVDLQNIDEAKMEALSMEFVASKLGIPVADMQKVRNMNPAQAEAFIKKNYPSALQKATTMGVIAGAGSFDEEEEESPYLVLKEELDAIFEAEFGTDDEQLQKVIELTEMYTRGEAYSTDRGYDAMTEDEKTMLNLYNEIVTSWRESETYKKVDAISETLSNRVDEWMKSPESGDKDQYPAWWVEGRKEQNRLIREWNKTQAERWNAQLKKCDRKEAFLQKVAAFEQKMDAQKDKIHPTEYYMLRVDLLKCRMLIQHYISLPFNINQCPLQGYFSEYPGIYG